MSVDGLVGVGIVGIGTVVACIIVQTVGDCVDYRLVFVYSVALFVRCTENSENVTGKGGSETN